MANEHPDNLTLRLKEAGKLKGGDNSHIQASWLRYVNEGKPCGVSIADFEDLGHKERLMGTTNVGDATTNGANQAEFGSCEECGRGAKWLILKN